MLRFIIKRRFYDSHIPMDSEALYTIDSDVPELEQALRAGGHGPDGFLINDLVGVELLALSEKEE